MKLKLNAILLFSLIGLGLATPVTTDEKVLATRGNNTVLDNDGSLREPHVRCDVNGDCPRYFGCRNGWCWCLPYETSHCQVPDLGLATPVATDEKVLATRGNNTAFDNDGSLAPHPPCMPNGDCPRYFGCRNGWCWCLPYHIRDCQGPTM